MTGGKTILTVDDSRTRRDMLLAALTEMGHRVVQPVDGLAGLERLREQPADLIITDINMPRLDGFGFIEEVRRDPRFRAPPILVLPTESHASRKDRPGGAGATGWIVKPFDPAKLADAI